MATGKEMCEIIVQALKKENPEFKVTPEEIWKNLSPTGDLGYIVVMYIEAKYQLGLLTEEDKKNPMVQLYLSYRKQQEAGIQVIDKEVLESLGAEVRESSDCTLIKFPGRLGRKVRELKGN